jgi:hypothetical protein
MGLYHGKGEGTGEKGRKALVEILFKVICIRNKGYLDGSNCDNELRDGELHNNVL